MSLDETVDWFYARGYKGVRVSKTTAIYLAIAFRALALAERAVRADEMDSVRPLRRTRTKGDKT